MLLDTLLRVTIIGPQFCEIFTAILCVGALGFAWFWHENEGIEGAGDEVLVAVVCLTQYLRIATLVKSTRDKHVHFLEPVPKNALCKTKGG